MYNFVKPNSISENNLNSYISIIGLAPCKVFSLLFEETFNDFDSILEKYNIAQFELEGYLNILQAAKLIQVSVVDESLRYEMFKPILLTGSEDQKWTSITNREVQVGLGSNISKTYLDIFNKPFSPETTNTHQNHSWVNYFEDVKSAKINVSELILINQVQINYKLTNEIVNEIISKTFQKCQKWNPKYFELVAKTFSKLKINTVNKAQKFFSGKLFATSSNNDLYLQEIEKELKTLEAKNG